MSSAETFYWRMISIKFEDIVPVALTESKNILLMFSRIGQDLRIPLTSLESPWFSTYILNKFQQM